VHDEEKEELIFEEGFYRKIGVFFQFIVDTHHLFDDPKQGRIQGGWRDRGHTQY